MLAEIDRVAVGNRRADMHQEVGAHRTIVGIDVRPVIGGDFFGTAVVVAGIAHERALETIASFPARHAPIRKGYITAGFSAQIPLEELGLTALLAQSPAEVHIADAGAAAVATDLFKLLQIHGKRSCARMVDIDGGIG
ncbi:hypothetical protein D3C87_1366270 [compost metagenome]